MGARRRTGSGTVRTPCGRPTLSSASTPRCWRACDGGRLVRPSAAVVSRCAGIPHAASSHAAWQLGDCQVAVAIDRNSPVADQFPTAQL
ncbi:hypothetical protein BDV11DRAFT_185485 [Aspergillus similis]